MAQQTAVEWIINELELYYNGESKLLYVDIITNAKQLEKWQIMTSFSIGNNCGYNFAKTEDSQQFNSAEQYYNETYNQ